MRFFSPKMRACLALFLLLIGGFAWKYCEKSTLWKLRGQTMGHIRYTIQYNAPKKRLSQQQTDQFLHRFNAVFSTYLPTSEISQLNAQDTLTFQSPLWGTLLKEAKWAYLQSKGAFDPTIGQLVNVWGFGPSRNMSSDTIDISTLLSDVGFDKLRISETGIRKKSAQIALDMSAIAKGYAVDLLAKQLEALGMKNYMVEVGGEVYVSGKKDENRHWRIGIQDPIRPTLQTPAATLQLPKGGIATSGNYHNYRNEGGNRYVHTINPRNGRPIEHPLLSATVWAATCARADALATACLVLGLREAEALVARTKEVEGLFFYMDSTSNVRILATKGIRSYLSNLHYKLSPL